MVYRERMVVTAHQVQLHKITFYLQQLNFEQKEIILEIFQFIFVQENNINIFYTSCVRSIRFSGAHGKNGIDGKDGKSKRLHIVFL